MLRAPSNTNTVNQNLPLPEREGFTAIPGITQITPNPPALPSRAPAIRLNPAPIALHFPIVPAEAHEKEPVLTEIDFDNKGNTPQF